jgi:hypothetical protein
MNKFFSWAKKYLTATAMAVWIAAGAQAQNTQQPIPWDVVAATKNNTDNALNNPTWMVRATITQENRITGLGVTRIITGENFALGVDVSTIGENTRVIVWWAKSSSTHGAGVSFTGTHVNSPDGISWTQVILAASSNKINLGEDTLVQLEMIARNTKAWSKDLGSREIQSSAGTIKSTTMQRWINTTVWGVWINIENPTIWVNATFFNSKNFLVWVNTTINWLLFNGWVASQNKHIVPFISAEWRMENGTSVTIWAHKWEKGAIIQASINIPISGLSNKSGASSNYKTVDRNIKSANIWNPRNYTTEVTTSTFTATKSSNPQSVGGSAVNPTKDEVPTSPNGETRDVNGLSDDNGQYIHTFTLPDGYTIILSTKTTVSGILQDPDVFIIDSLITWNTLNLTSFVGNASQNFFNSGWTYNVWVIIGSTTIPTTTIPTTTIPTNYFININNVRSAR